MNEERAMDDKVNLEPVSTDSLDHAIVPITDDSPIAFEEYVYYASITRADEKASDELYRSQRGPRTVKNLIKDRFSTGHHNVEKPEGHNENAVVTSAVTPEEWKNASRAIRTAGWGAIFYLITTDILGPFSTAWSFAQMGYGPGIALYTVFGAMSA